MEFSDCGSKINQIVFTIVTVLLVLTSTTVHAVETDGTCNWTEGLYDSVELKMLFQVFCFCQNHCGSTNVYVPCTSLKKKKNHQTELHALYLQRVQPIVSVVVLTTNCTM